MKPDFDSPCTHLDWPEAIIIVLDDGPALIFSTRSLKSFADHMVE